MRPRSEQWGGGTPRPSPKATTRSMLALTLLGGLGLPGCAHSPRPPPTRFLACQVDPALREPVARPPLPQGSSQEAMAVFSINQEMTISLAELQRNYAVKSLDNCNQANTLLAQALAKPPGKPWWRVW
jgi:hypothetical protein